MPYRLIYTGLALVAIAAIALTVALAPEGDPLELPEVLEAVSPEPASLVPQQTTLIVDLPVGYEAQIIVDGWPITDSTFVEATGVYRWTPSAVSPVIQEWSPGEHTITVIWDTYTGLPDTGSFEWTFRVG